MGDAKLGKILKEAREKLGLTQEQVAMKAGRSTNWYARFERGEENALQETRDVIFKVLKKKLHTGFADD
ncbi:helix-turn-helix transcriptional regulator [Candidatus Roizmanbacteria bacterium]|nr:helix-turn-helix transcriptional regulator [Candidatus Roizmanbacteria bacterium]